MRRRTMALVALLAVVGCSNSSDDSTPALSTAEATGVAAAVFQDLAAALATATFSAPPSVPSVRLQPTQSGSTSFGASCPSGGTISGSMNYTFTYSDDGLSGSTSESLTFGFHNCVVATGERNLTVNGDLTSSESSNYSYTGDQLSEQFSYQLDGSITWSGGSCPMHYSVTGNFSGGGESYRLTGSVCGQSVSYTS